MSHVWGSFRGLSVGVDKYLSDEIPELRTAQWDAQVVHALFTDNFGPDSFTLLVDEMVTRARLLAELARLRDSCTPDDVVVIMFSGHGSTTHDLLTHDADLEDLAGTALPAAELFDCARSIPARQVIVILDCCFSGGAAAKAVVVPGAVTAPMTPVLDEPGCLVLAACAADEAAYEDREDGYGLLTRQLVQGLLGRAEVVANDSMPVRDLLRLVGRLVAGRASMLDLRQTPVVTGDAVDGVSWPVMAAGPRYRALVAPDEPEPVTSDLGDLVQHGVSADIVEVWRRAIGSLNSLQVMAVNERGVLRGESAVIIAPTAAGKTMVGEMAAVRAALHRGRAVFLVPSRALVNELYERFKATYGTLGLRVVRATGALSSDVPAIIKGRYTLAVLTYETYAGLVQVHPELLDQIGTLVVDEVQTIADAERGAALEMLLTSVVSRTKARRPQVVALSSGLGENHSHLDTWLDARALVWSERPQRLVEGVLDADGGFRGRDDAGTDVHTELVVRQKYDAGFNAVESMIRQDVAAGRQVIVFRSSRRGAIKEAVHLAGRLGLPRASAALTAMPREDATRVRMALDRCLAGGVAFHNADLSESTKRAVESAFRAQENGIRVLVSTTTLAQGVNLPADVVIVRDLEYPRPGRPLEYTVGEYKNMAGRAGRRTEGRSVIPVESADAEEIWSTYVTGVPEVVRSSLLRDGLDLETVVLRAVAILSRVEHVVRVRHVHEFLSRSLGAHQSRVEGTPFRLTRLHISAVADTLAELGLLQDTDELAVTPLGDVVSSGTLCVRSAVKSVALLRRVDADDVTDKTLLAIAQCTEELDAVPVDHTVTWRQLIGHMERQGLPRPVTDAIVNAPNPVDRAARALICLTWTRLITMTEVEDALSPGNRWTKPAVPIAPVLSRTRDVIGTVVRLARAVHRSARDDLGLLDLQLDHGVPAGLSELASRAGGSLDRWDYQCLGRQSLREPTLILGKTVDELAHVLGDDLVKASHVLELATAIVSAEQSYARLSAGIS